MQSTPGYWGKAIADLGSLIKLWPSAVSGQSQSEDCLFLDVISPARVFNGARSDSSKLVPVLVNIHGGGFFIGDKSSIYPPQGLLKQSDNGIVYVSMNYRVSPRAPRLSPRSNVGVESSVPLAS